MIETTTTSPTMRVRELAAREGVKQELVLKWIGSGELEAINYASPEAKRPLWRIRPEAWEEFQRRRSSVASVARPKARVAFRLPKVKRSYLD